MNRLISAVRITRPVNSGITALVVIAGGMIALDNAAPVTVRLLLAALSAAMIAGGGNAVNDAFDASIDAINRPERPIPAGLITPITAHLSGLLLMMTGTGLGFILDFRMGIIALLVFSLLELYSACFKRMPGTGNLVVALCGGLAFIYGAVAVDKMPGGVVPAFFAFLIHLSREIVKDAEDEIGDHETGARTLPIVIGSYQAQKIAAGILLLLFIVTPLPYILKLFGSTYLLMIIILVNLPLLWTIIILSKGTDHRGLSRISRMLKIMMLTGLISLYFGSNPPAVV